MSTNLKKNTRGDKSHLVFDSFLARDILLHKDISNRLKVDLASITNKITSSREITKDGIMSFLKFHPIHVVRANNNKAYCIANLRGYQLVKAFLEDDILVPTLVHPKSKNMSIDDLASLDSMLSALVYGLEKTEWRSDFFSIWNNVNNKTCKRVFPAIKNKTALAKFINSSRLFLYKKDPEHPRSLLKHNIKKGAFNDP